jgi:hypothetical protein
VDPTVFTFGSRGGSVAALVFFGLIMLVLTLGVARALRSAGVGRRLRVVFAGVLFGGLMALIYLSSLSGFYTVEVTRERLVTRLLIPGLSTTIPSAAVTSVTAQPSFRGRWFLVIRTADQRFYSANASRQEATAAEEQVRQLLLQR